MKYITTLLLLSSLVIGGCSKTSTTTGPPTGSSSYYPLAIGNWWKYITTDSTKTLTVIGNTQFNGKTYFMIYDASTGDSIRIRKEGPIYYSLFPDSTGTTLHEVIFYNETSGSTWGYDLTILVFTGHATYTYVATGQSRTVNGKTYTNVTQIHIDQIFAGVTSSVELYMAKGVGEIEEVDDSGTSIESLQTYHVN
jgi:hypothetical protein